MQNHALLVSSLLRHAERNHPAVPIISCTVEGPVLRFDYASWAERTRRLAAACRRLGAAQGDRIATLAWNTHRHLELFFAVPGIGAVCHTINPRLFEDQIRYIVDHAQDRFVFLDSSFLELVERLAPGFPSVEAYVLMTDRAHMPASSTLPLLCYEDLLAAESGELAWPELDERTASSLCYTSGTTGNPKGVLYSHRSTLLHTYAMCMPDNHALSVRDCTMPVAPMFHANAWGVPYGACATGAKIVLPGRMIDGPSLHRLIESERVTHSVAVPTVWRMYLDYIENAQLTTGTLRRVIIGGTAMPRDVLHRFARFGVSAQQGWGMTEMSPLGTSCVLRPELEGLDDAQRADVLCKQGLSLFGVELRIADDEGRELPRDGRSIGHLQVRGPWIASAYFASDERAAWLPGGWFDTGDIAAIDGLGYVQITDRAKDVIKSGGEWISSMEVERLASEHPAVAEAAVIAMHDPRWDERPLLIVVRKPGATVSGEELIEFLRDRIAKWWLPDAVEFVPQMPYTATGKISKKTLRERFTGYQVEGR
ncbi:MAG TPA: long-chain fatty acid--CoA ligase [Steroidobacteraceae bacterium]|nr:long-chain fatty acid--CoA ligase [Steroidobacteraceae bacterium]